MMIFVSSTKDSRGNRDKCKSNKCKDNKHKGKSKGNKNNHFHIQIFKP